MTSQPSVVAILKTLEGKRRIEDNHALDQYISAFEDFPPSARRFLAAGGDFIVIELEDGNVLKISNRTIADPLGCRDFDIPSLEIGTRTSRWGLPISYVIQPKAELPADDAAARAFRISLRERGYFMADGGRDQVGLYRGQPKLLDLFAVQRLPDV